MFYNNFLYLLFLFFLKFKSSIFSKVTSYNPQDLAYLIYSYNSFIYSFEYIYDEQNYLNRLKSIYFDYNLYTYICYIDSINDEEYTLKAYLNELQNHLQYYFTLYYKDSAFIILIENKHQVMVIMGDTYLRKFTINDKNNVKDFANYISVEFSGNDHDIEYVFDYTITQLENALEGDEIEPGKTFSIALVVIIVVIIIIAIAIIIFCCRFFRK